MKKNEHGQSVIETLVVLFFLILISFTAIEVIRIQYFKSILQSSVQNTSQWFSYHQIDLIKTNIIHPNIPLEELNHEKTLSDVSDRISQDLSLARSSLLSFDEPDAHSNSGIRSLKKHSVRVYVDFVNKSSNDKQSLGVYVKVNACLPVLFISIYKKFEEKIQIGKKINPSYLEQNCLGLIVQKSNSMPSTWFRVRAASFSAWPSSTDIYFHALRSSQSSKVLEKDSIMAVNELIDGTETNKNSYTFANKSPYFYSMLYEWTKNEK